MTGQQLLALRKSRNQSREELAEFLGSCTGSAISHWEKDRTPIPEWAVEKLMKSAVITLPIDDMVALIEIARVENIDFPSLLTEAIREHIGRRSGKIISYQALPAPESSRVAEDPLP